jgi:ATP-dependent RNA helicase DeaD
MHEQFAEVDKDELIRKLIWLQLKDTIDAYQDADDLNAGYEGKDKGARGSRYTRIFINLGEKDGLNTQKLIQFITESVDIDANVIERVTVRDLSSFFNVPGDAAEYIVEHLSSKKFKGRKVRLEEAEQGRGGAPGGGGYGGGGGEHRKPKPSGGGGGARYSGDVRSFGKRDGGGGGYSGGGGYKGKRK